MKKITIILLVLAITFALVVGLVACKEDDDTVTDSSLSKVQKAFDGVERSMQSVSTAKNVNKGIKLASMSQSDALSAIWNAYVSGDKQASASAEIKYDEPPMQQFRYLKAIFEEMGNDYELGTKYSYDITGQIYMDMETGYRVESTAANAEACRYDYVFTFSMSVIMNDDDSIFSEVGFNISLTQGNKNYKTAWYVSFDLDYDFNENQPTYTLAMYTDNKEGELAFLNRVQGYEYDYVQVEKGAIKEWRKFGLETEKEIVFSGKYSSFEDYIAEGMAYNTDTCKWLKNGDFYKVTQYNAEKTRARAICFADGLGMNSTDIKSAAFFGKESKQNEMIRTFYQRICREYGDDIIYDLVCKKEDSGKNGGSQAWDATVPQDVKEVLPTFYSQNGTFRLTPSANSENGLVIEVTGASHDDYERFKGALQSDGFTATEQEGAYFKEDGERVYVVMVDEANCIVTFFVGARNSSIEIKYGYAYDREYKSYETSSVSSYDLENEIEAASSGTITGKELNGMFAGEKYTITLNYTDNIDATAELFAQAQASAYKGKYVSWRQMCDSSVNYTTQEDYDVVVLITSAGSGNDAYVYVYVLLFGRGEAENIVEGNTQQGENGENGNHGQPEEPEKPLDPEEPGDPQQPGDPGEEPQGIQIYVAWLDENKNVLSDGLYSHNAGEEIDVTAYLSEEGQRIYTDKDCTVPAGKTIYAELGLQLYVWKEVRKGTFMIIDVTEEATQLYSAFDCPEGDKNYYGYSFGYLLYWDEACTQKIDLTYNFEMTTDGITVYRHIYEDFFVVNVKTYVNGHYLEDAGYSNSVYAYRKEKIYFLTDSSTDVIEFYIYRANLDQNATFYVGEGQEESNRLNAGSYFATNEDSVTIYVYANNDYYRFYTLKVGEDVITENYYVVGGGEFVPDGGIFTYKNKMAEYCTVSGNVIYMHNVRTMNGQLRAYYTWNGKVVNENSGYVDTYFFTGESDTYPSFQNDVTGPSGSFFTDPECTTPIVFTEYQVEYAPGEYYTEIKYVVDHSMTLYSPLYANIIP